MAIDVDALERVANAGHPDQALVGLPVSLVREIAQRLRVAEIACATTIGRARVASGAA